MKPSYFAFIIGSIYALLVYGFEALVDPPYLVLLLAGVVLTGIALWVINVYERNYRE